MTKLGVIGRGRCAFIALLALCVAMSCAVSGDCAVVYVKTTGLDTNSGASWELAKKTVGAGLNAATSGGEVWVAAGTYLECITLKLGVGLYGGFAGTETQRDQRKWTTNKTIFDGNQSGSVLTSPYRATATTRIDGFTIRNGKASFGGGGIYCYSSSPTITNNTIRGNSAGWGGGIHCGPDSSPTISNNTISRNSAHSGGGIYCYNASSMITNNTIDGNTADCGGGISCLDSFSTIRNNTVSGNRAASWGGGIYLRGPLTISNNIVAFNSSGVGEDEHGGTPTLRNNCVYNPDGYNYSFLEPGVGDIQADPFLVDRANGDYHLSLLSPCINSGYNADVTPGALDMDGEPRTWPVGGTVDIGADEYTGQPVWSPGEAKKLVADGQTVYLTSRGPMVVTAKFDEMPAFYVEKSDRTSGIQCRAVSLLDPGQCGIVHGTMDTIDGERVLANADVVSESLFTAQIPKALGMNNAALGGGAAGLQEGIFGVSGLNNIGLLVTTWGVVTKKDEQAFYVDDGSGCNDGYPQATGVRVIAPPGVSTPPRRHYVHVTGISSCYKVRDNTFRLLRVRDGDDIKVLEKKPKGRP